MEVAEEAVISSELPPRETRPTVRISMFIRGRPIQVDLLDLKLPPDRSAFAEIPRKIKYDNAARHPRGREARIRNDELAERMRLSAEEPTDLSRECQATHAMHGLYQEETREFDERCWIARRLIERGVRLIQIITKNQYWDHHGGIVKALPASCRKIDEPAAALVRDLKQRGLLDTRVVYWEAKWAVFR